MRPHFAFGMLLICVGQFGVQDTALGQQGGTVKATSDAGTPDYARTQRSESPVISYTVSGATLGPRTREELASTSPLVEYKESSFVPGATIVVSGTVFNNRPEWAVNKDVAFTGEIIVGSRSQPKVEKSSFKFEPGGTRREFSISATIPDDCERVVITLSASGGTVSPQRTSMRATLLRPSAGPVPAGPASRKPGIADLTGEWEIIGDGHRGKITISQQDGNQFTGKITFPGYQPVNLANGRIEGNTVTFTRFFPPYRQDYTGTLTVESDGRATISGTLTQNGAGSMRWTATRTGAAPTRPAPADPPRVDPPATPPSVATMTLRADSRKAKTGETVTVPLWLLKGAGLIDLNFNVEYDPAVVQPVGNVVRGNLLPGADFEANTAKRGVVQLGLVPKAGGIGAADGTLAQVSFRAVGKPGTRTALRIVPRKGTIAGGAAANPATIHGEIQIVGDDGFIPGDISGDGKVDMADVLMALKISVELLPHNPRADVDKDGQVTAADARLIREMVLGRR